jgi:hypothetical protein
MMRILFVLALLALAIAGALVDAGRGRRPALVASRLF